METYKDDREIIYIALSNQCLNLKEALESNELHLDERKMYEYLLSRTEQIHERFEKEISTETEDLLNKYIDRPKF